MLEEPAVTIFRIKSGTSSTLKMEAAGSLKQWYPPTNYTASHPRSPQCEACKIEKNGFTEFVYSMGHNLMVLQSRNLHKFILENLTMNFWHVQEIKQ
jgi:hypothetical protein